MRGGVEGGEGRRGCVGGGGLRAAGARGWVDRNGREEGEVGERVGGGKGGAEKEGGGGEGKGQGVGFGFGGRC